MLKTNYLINYTEKKDRYYKHFKNLHNLLFIIMHDIEIDNYFYCFLEILKWKMQPIFGVSF